MAPVDPVSTSLSGLASADGANPTFKIRQFRDSDLDQVVAIFAEGMTEYPEHQNSPQLAEYIKQSRESDLSDIAGTYLNAGGNFWVVTPESEPETVVGMVALEAKSDREGELRRMSVKHSYRRYGIGRLLISTLEQWAAANGYHKVWLTTGAVMKKACAFYEASGYAKVGTISFEDNFVGYKFEKTVNSTAAAY